VASGRLSPTLPDHNSRVRSINGAATLVRKVASSSGSAPEVGPPFGSIEDLPSEIENRFEARMDYWCHVHLRVGRRTGIGSGV
jgi:hypothetical protein